MKILFSLKNKIITIIQSVFTQFKNFNKRTLIIISSVLFLFVLFLVVKNIVFKPKEKEKEKEIIKVKVEAIKKGDFSQKYAVMGTIKGVTENELRFEIEGLLLRYNYREGTRISKGSIIAYLDTKDGMAKLSYAKSKYESEKAAYFSAEQKLKVYEDLFKLKAISESKLTEIRFEVEAIRQRMATALAELELTQLNLLKTNLLAPSNGILAEIIVQPGEFITPQDVVAKFISTGDVNLEVEIPEKDVGQIKTNLNSHIVCDAYSDKTFYGTISEIAPVVKERTRTVVVKIRIPNDEGLLRSGMFARGDVLISGATNVITVPVDSIVSLGEETKLLPLVKQVTEKQNQGIVELRHIKVGSTLEKKIIVTDGVEEGELYITETSGELSDGILVEYIGVETK